MFGLSLGMIIETMVAILLATTIEIEEHTSELQSPC